MFTGHDAGPSLRVSRVFLHGRPRAVDAWARCSACCSRAPTGTACSPRSRCSSRRCWPARRCSGSSSSSSVALRARRRSSAGDGSASRRSASCWPWRWSDRSILLGRGLFAGLTSDDAALHGATMALVSGPLAIPFWVRLVGGLAIPLVLIALPATRTVAGHRHRGGPRLRRGVRRSAALRERPDRSSPRPPSGASCPTTYVAYTPSLVEISIVVGALRLRRLRLHPGGALPRHARVEGPPRIPPARISSRRRASAWPLGRAARRSRVHRPTTAVGRRAVMRADAVARLAAGSGPRSDAMSIAIGLMLAVVIITIALPELERAGRRSPVQHGPASRARRRPRRPPPSAVLAHGRSASSRRTPSAPAAMRPGRARSASPPSRSWPTRSRAGASAPSCHAPARLVDTAPGHSGIHASECTVCHKPGDLPAPLSRPHREPTRTSRACRATAARRRCPRT